MAFHGTFEHTLDAKNRLTVPARFRAALAEGAVVAKGIEPCLSIWTVEGYARFKAQALGDSNPLDPEARKLRRYFAASSFETELDSAHRVMLPSNLLEHGGLGREVAVVGADECLEVWDRAAWARYDAEVSKQIPDIAASLGHPV